VTLISDALDVASHGWPVFPCGASKHPCIAKAEGGQGFRDATVDADVVRSLFQHPNAKLIGVRTGEASGFDVLDFDYRNGAKDWEDANSYRLPETRTHETMSGGRHMLFKHVHGVRNSASKFAIGMDIRGEGGYAVVPPSAGYRIISDAEIADWPDWLLEIILARPPAKDERPAARSALELSSKRLEGLTRSILSRVSAAVPGGKHFALRNAALSLGGILDISGMAESEAVERLLSALPDGVLDWKGARTTALWGLQRGRDRPLELEDRQRPNGHAEPSVEPPDPSNDPGYIASLEDEDAAWQSVQTEAAAAVTREPKRDAPLLPFPASKVTPEELAALSPREWVYGHFLIRRFISAIGAPGGAGKTAYAYGVALAILTGTELLNETVHDPGNVWIYNLEDPRDELLKRLKAALIGHDIPFSEIADRIFLDSGRDRPLVIAHAERDGTVIAWPHVPSLIAELKAREIRLLIVDPFVRSHRVEENVNDQIDFVAALWAEVADKADCSVLLVHHFKKGGQSGDAGAFRGASALIDASRAAVTMASMSVEEAKGFNVPDGERWQYVRVDNAKLNLAPPPDAAVWLRLTGVDIDNARNGKPSDTVQTVKRWSPPSAWEGFSMAAVLAVLDAIQEGPEEGEQYTLTRGGRSARWAGQLLVDKAGKTEAQAAAILKAWHNSGLILSGRYTSPKQRRERDGLIVNPDKLAEMRKGRGSASWQDEG